MKRFVCIICGCWLFVSAPAQRPSLSITADKTTSLIFPLSILYVDRGTKDVLVRQVKEADNILLVKAASKNFSETNLSVITSDGSVYSFTVCYDNKPSLWVYHVPVSQTASMATYANSILDNKRSLHGITDHKRNMRAGITGIYIKDQVIYYQLKLINQSPINYNIDLLRFYIRDKKKNKRTAIQENELKPLHIAGNPKQVKARNTITMVIALEKFTIPDAKYLAVQIMEKNGGRHLKLKVSNSKIVKAVVLPDLH